LPWSNLSKYGFNIFHQDNFTQLAEPGDFPGRIVAEFQGIFEAHTESGEIIARPSGLLRRRHQDRNALPVIGDFILMRSEGDNEATIIAALPRQSVLARRASGGAFNQQALAANIDVIFVLTSLADEYNPRRLERFLVPAMESGAQTVIVSSKNDLTAKSSNARREMTLIAQQLPIIETSIVDGQGIDQIRDLLRPGHTGVLLGSSGTGKSSLANLLMGHNQQKTGEVRADGKGRHTTTNKQLIVMPNGGMLIDTPGLRELQMWASHAALDLVFAEISHAAKQCHFSDCTHSHEPGCRIQEMLALGELDEGRLANYIRISDEIRHLDSLGQRPASKEEQSRAKHLSRIYNRPKK